MEGKKKETSFEKSVCILSFELSEESLKNTSTVDNKQGLRSCNSLEKIKLSSFRSGCSKSCAKYRKADLDGAQTSDYKPQALRESSSRQKKFKTKPTGETPLSDQLKIKMKETSKKLQVFILFFRHWNIFLRELKNLNEYFRQSALPLFEKATKRTMAKIKFLYEAYRTRRVLGFKCDLKKCNSTLMECSARSCKKKSMIFGESSYSHDLKTADCSSTSDTLTMSDTSEKI